MTEYDYSPEAIERHLATQQRIARWVEQTHEHSPSDPFTSLPSEHSVPQMPQQNPQPAFYTTPQGVISPTYSSSRRHKHSQRHSPSSRDAPVKVPPGHRPVVSRSFSTPPPTLVRNFYPLPSMPYTGTPYPTGPPPQNPLPYGSSYQSSPNSYPSHSQTSSCSVSSSPIHHVDSVIQQQHRSNTYPYLQPSSSQSVVVVNRGDCVVVSAPGQHIQVIVCIEHNTFFVLNSLYFLESTTRLWNRE